MTRRYKPTQISTSHEATQRADMQREYSRPKAAPFERPEPAPEPVRQPKPGRPRNLNPPARESTAVLGMFDAAMRTTNDPVVKRRLRAAQRQMRSQLAQDLPPGAHPNAYGLTPGDL